MKKEINCTFMMSGTYALESDSVFTAWKEAQGNLPLPTQREYVGDSLKVDSLDECMIANGWDEEAVEDLSSMSKENLIQEIARRYTQGVEVSDNEGYSTSLLKDFLLDYHGVTYTPTVSQSLSVKTPVGDIVVSTNHTSDGVQIGLRHHDSTQDVPIAALSFLPKDKSTSGEDCLKMTVEGAGQKSQTEEEIDIDGIEDYFQKDGATDFSSLEFRYHPWKWRDKVLVSRARQSVEVLRRLTEKDTPVPREAQFLIKFSDGTETVAFAEELSLWNIPAGGLPDSIELVYDVNPKYQNADRNGQVVKVVKELSDKSDPMFLEAIFLVRFNDGTETGAYHSELLLTDVPTKR